MNPKNVAFRSRRERESEVKLHENYRDIGIAALAAASDRVRRDRLARLALEEKALQAERPQD